MMAQHVRDDIHALFQLPNHLEERASFRERRGIGQLLHHHPGPLTPGAAKRARTPLPPPAALQGELIRIDPYSRSTGQLCPLKHTAVASKTPPMALVTVKGTKGASAPVCAGRTRR